jgi:hypothetical protein
MKRAPEVGTPRAAEENASNLAAEAASALMRAMLGLLILHSSDNFMKVRERNSVYENLRHRKCLRLTRCSE